MKPGVINFSFPIPPPFCTRSNEHAQFGIYEFVRKEIMNRKDEEQPRNWLPPALRRTLGMEIGALQPDYFKDFLKNVRLMEEELV